MTATKKKTGRPGKLTYTAADGTRKLMAGRQRVQSFIPADVATKLKLIAVVEGKLFSEVVSEALVKFVAHHKSLGKAR